ncbi:hypothetical protein [uncultured Brevundimonas sp.]|uniref:hypothetical protein n=1 Tax=uncultured Brevundimonas sp. TaxID=213418 RepID=UPI0025E312D4|nr:hypothetical protein [uncultured Brevundimonas sp.]
MIELEAMSTAPGGVLAARGGAAEAPEGFAAVTHDGWIVTDDQGRTVMVEAAA